MIFNSDSDLPKIISIRFDSRQKVDSNRFVRFDSTGLYIILLHGQLCYNKDPTLEYRLIN